MKICFFIASLGDGGAQRQCIALLNQLQELDDLEMHLILLRSGEHDDTLHSTGIKVHRTSVGNFANPRGLLFAIRILRKIRPDVVVSWLLPADIWTYFATRVVRGIPWIMTERNSYYPDEFDSNLRRRLGRYATTIVANSEEGRRFWEKQGVKTPIRHIPNIITAPDAQQPAMGNPIRTSSSACLFVGRLEAQKNILSTVDAFATFAKEHPPSRLIVVGQGSLAEQMMRIATAEGVAQQIQMLGFRKDVPAIMNDSRILISLSRHEGMPNVIMEAVSADLPAVVSDIPEHRALLGEEYPYYVPLDASPAATAATMSKAWRASSEVCPDIYADARKVLSKMGPEAVIPAYIKLFEQAARQMR